METKHVPNIFMSLYRLARQDNYDISKWRDILTGIHRKSKEKHNIKNLCLLYYSLFKGCTNKDLSSMEISYRDRITRQNLGPLNIRDIGDAYIDKVSELMKYMNTKQIAMISKFLLMMNRLNEPLCNIILSKINSDNVKITPRSFFNIILSLSESNHVDTDSIERLLLQNKDFLYNMNRLDLMYLLKSVSINNIKNETILTIISDKLEYYSQDMRPEELLSTLHSLYTLNWSNETILRNLFFRIQSLLDKYDTSSLVLISKYLSHFNLKDIKDFFDLQLIPMVHERVENYDQLSHIMDPYKKDTKASKDNKEKLDSNSSSTNKTSTKNPDFKDTKPRETRDREREREKHRELKEHSRTTLKSEQRTDKTRNTDELLLFYNYCLRSGSISFPKLLFSLIEELKEEYQWNLLFSILYRYQINLNYSPSYTNGLINYYKNKEKDIINLKDDNYIIDNNNNKIIFNPYLINNNNTTTSNRDSNLESNGYINLALKAIDTFKNYINRNEISPKYITSIIKYIIELGIDDEELCLEILKKIEKSENYKFENLVDILFNLHTVDNNSDYFNEKFEKLMKNILEDRKSFDSTYFIHILCILFNRKIEIPSEFVDMFKSIFTSNESQDRPWEIPGQEVMNNNNTNTTNSSNTGSNSSRTNKTSTTTDTSNSNTNKHIYNINTHKRHILNTPDDTLEYLLYTIIFPNRQDMDMEKSKFMDFKNEICTIFKMIKRFRKDNLINGLLYYIGTKDENLLKYLLEIKDIDYRELSIEVVKIDRVPDLLTDRFKEMECILIKNDEDNNNNNNNIIFNPYYLVPGTKDVYYFDTSREKWDCVSRNILRAILHQNNYTTHKI